MTFVKDQDTHSLLVLAAGEGDDVGGGGVLRAEGIAGLALLERRHGRPKQRLGRAHGVAGNVLGRSAEEAPAGVGHEVWLLDDTTGGVGEGEVHDGARVARVEDGSQTTTGREGLDEKLVAGVRMWQAFAISHWTSAGLCKWTLTVTVVDKTGRLVVDRADGLHETIGLGVVTALRLSAVSGAARQP